jgi:release factor glutamine methyltransferase
MTIADWLIETMVKLGKAGVDSPRRDALVLLEDVLEKDRTWVLAHSEDKLTATNLKKVNELVARRIKREPLAYIRGRAWFYGRFFDVNPDVLIPRPETEGLVELVLGATKLKKAKVADIGCGSGVIGITLKLERPNWRIDLIDIDKKALEIAQKNCQNHKVELEIIESDLLEGLETNYDIIVANLPYVPDGLITSPEIETEPKIALFAGEDGLEVYRKFWNQVEKLTKKPKTIALESLESQHMIMAGLAQKSEYILTKTQGLAQLYTSK